MMPLGLSGGDHVSIISREDRTVTNGAGCSDGAEIKSNTRVSVTSGREIERSVLLTDIYASFLILIVTIS